jgi:hypothetical protein
MVSFNYKRKGLFFISLIFIISLLAGVFAFRTLITKSAIEFLDKSGNIISKVTNSTTSSTEKINLATTGLAEKTTFPIHNLGEKFEQNGLEISVNSFGKYDFITKIGNYQDIYCAPTVTIKNIKHDVIYILSLYDFEIIDGSPAGGIPLSTELVQEYITKPNIAFLEKEKTRLDKDQSVTFSIPMLCQQFDTYQLNIRTTQFDDQIKDDFNLVEVKLM